MSKLKKILLIVAALAVLVPLAYIGVSHLVDVAQSLPNGAWEAYTEGRLSLGEIFDPKGNPFAHRFSDMKDIRTATFVVAASDSEHRYDVDFRCSGANDHIEIQAAIDALPAGGGEVVLLEGQFNIAATLHPVSGLHLKGQGNPTEIRITIDDLDMIVPTSSASNVTIEDIYFNNTRAYAVDVILTTATYPGNNIKVLNCEFNNVCLVLGGTWHGGASGTNFWAIGNYMHDITHDGDPPRAYGIWLDGITRPIISDNIIRDVDTSCILMDECSRVLVEGNHLHYAGAAYYCLDVGTSNDVIVSGNTIESHKCIEGHGSGCLEIVDNLVVGSAHNTNVGIYIDRIETGNPYYDEVVIADNIIKKFHYAMSLDDEKNLLIIGNHMHDVHWGVVITRTAGWGTDYDNVLIASNIFTSVGDGAWYAAINISVDDDPISHVSIIGNRLRGTDTVGSFGIRGNINAPSSIVNNDIANFPTILEGAIDADVKIRENTDYVGICETRTFRKTVNYDDASPVAICSVEDGYCVTDVWVEVVTTFDDGGARIDIGDGVDPDGFLDQLKINQALAGYYGLEADDRGDYLWDAANTHIRQKIYTAADTVDATITKTNGTQGVAIVYVKVTRIGG